jgi:hypothetical protein
MMDYIHPDDQSWLLTIAVKTKEIYFKVSREKLMKYKVQFDAGTKTTMVNSYGFFTRV